MTHGAARAPGWYFLAWHGRGRWIGMAKRSPFVYGHPLHEPGEVWFAMGATKRQALANIERSVAVDAAEIPSPENSP